MRLLIAVTLLCLFFVGYSLPLADQARINRERILNQLEKLGVKLENNIMFMTSDYWDDEPYGKPKEENSREHNEIDGTISEH
ncbi:unnamed protein product [Caenorhabditis brenneri]